MTSDATNSENRYAGVVLADRYEVGELISQDAMTETHLAQDRELGATVAIKLLSPQLAEDTAFAERFVDDALWATTVRGPTIISILDAGASDGVRYVVQEYAEGQTLGQKLRNVGKLDPDTACEIMEQVLTALAVAHEVGIVHGDINPANIIVTGPRSVKLLDLGIAHVRSTHTVAETRAMMGHPEYLSPEQAQGDQFDARTDIYSAGIVFYEMLTGKPPFSGDSPVAVFYMHIHDAPKPITQGNPDVPSPIADTVAKALLKKPEERFQTAEQFRRAVEIARSMGKVPSAATQAPSPTAPATEAPSPAASPAGAPKTEEQAPPEPKAKGPKADKPKSGDRVSSITSGAEDMRPKTMVFSPGGATRRRGGLLIGVAALVLLAALGLGFRVLVGSGNIIVPELAQMPRDKAIQELKDAGLEWRVLEEESSEYAPGSVMGQAPAPGAAVPKGTEMVLTIAKAPSVVRVPDLTGVVSQAAAEDRLKAEGIQIGTITEEVNLDYHEGSVIAQDPTAGTVVTPHTKVNLTIAVSK